MMQIVLKELFQSGFRTFRFPYPGEYNDVWRLLLIYSLEERGARVMNLRTGKTNWISAAEVVIPEREITTSEASIKVELTREKQKKHWLSRSVHKGLYVSLIFLLCLVLYLVIAK